MKRRFSLAAAAVIAVILIGLSGCYYYDEIDGSGILVDLELAYADFDSIDIQIEGVSVTVTPSAEFGITLTADDNIIDFVTVYPAEGGGSLIFALDRNVRYSQVSVSLHFRMPTITSLTIGHNSWYYNHSIESQVTVESGFSLTDLFEIDCRRADLFLDDLIAADLSIEWYEAGNVTGSISSSDFELYASSTGTIDLSGSAINLDLSASGSGDFDLSGLDVTDATVAIANSADVTLAVSGSISGTIEVESSLTNDVVLSPDTSGLVDENLAAVVE